MSKNKDRIFNWERYANEGWCDGCKRKIGATSDLLGYRELVAMNDGYGNYFIFDSYLCCENYVRQFGSSLEGCGTHSSDYVDRIADNIKKKPNWHISWTSLKIIQKRNKDRDDREREQEDSSEWEY